MKKLKGSSNNLVAKNAYKAGSRCLKHVDKKHHLKAGNVKHNYQKYSLIAFISVIKKYFR